MNQGNSQSYLDLSVLPDLRTCVLTTRPVVVFSENLDAIVWANAAGAQLFGGTGVADLLTLRISSENPLIRQLGHAVGQMNGSERITRGIRINRSLRSQMLQFEIERLELPGEQTGYKITHLADDTGDPDQENQIAQMAIESLAGFADAAAITDDFGLPVFSSEEFENLGPDESALADLVAELKSEDDRLIKRPIHSTEGTPVAIGLARLTDEPGRNLVVVAKVSDIPEEVPASPEIVPEEAPQDRDPTEDETTAEFEVDAEQPATADIAEEDAGIQEPGPDTVSPAPSEIPLAEPLGSSESDDAIRFAWTVDQNGTFTFVSEELADAVGPHSADIVGRHWQDIADILGFDKDNVIGRLLEQKDTWSGKVVLWPVEDTDKVVPVSLAALPIFGPDREFEGFRGYGKISLAELQDDSNAADPAPETHEHDPDHDEEPEIKVARQIVEDEDRDADEIEAVKHPSNIVPFARNREDEPRESLSEAERNALKAVREHLQEEPVEKY